MEKDNRIKGLEWCPEADLNHRHADFQSRSICGSPITSSENSVKPSTEDQILSGNLSDQEAAIEEAAIWLSEHRDECSGGSLFPKLKARFGLRNIHAIEAAKRAHALQYVRAL